MHYYQFNIADYRKDTTHLSRLEHSIYRDLIDWYYLDESPIPLETHSVTRRLRLVSEEEAKALENVLSDFFIKEDGWHHRRIDQDIIEYHAMAEKNKANGKLGGRPKKTHSVSSGMPDETQSKGNQEPRTNNQEEPKPIAPTARFDPKANLMAKGIDDSLAADWITLRRAKKAPPTEAAITGIEREADKARITLADALSLCCQRGWAGFKAEWALQTPGGGVQRGQTRHDQQMDTMAALTGGRFGSGMFDKKDKSVAARPALIEQKAV